MKAIVWAKYGPPEGLEFRELEMPIPKDKEILVKVHAATVTTGDCEIRRLEFPFGLGFLVRLGIGYKEPREPTILGQEFAGEIESVGKDVKQFKKGDQIFAATDFSFGAYAEYVRIPSKYAMAKKPANITYEEAAAVPVGGIEALYFLRKGNIQSGQKVLIIGAGGSIGTAAVQLAKYFGAEVTAVDITGKLEMLSSIGADHVIDYTQEDFTKNGETYDVIFDIVYKSSFSGCMHSLKKKGYYISAIPKVSLFFRMLWTSMTSSKKVRFGMAPYKSKDLIFLKGIIEEGKLKSVIDRSYPLEQVPEAHRYVETGQKKGNVIITVAQNDRRTMPDADSSL